MTKKEVADIIASCGFLWRYSHFSETPTPPYIVYYYPSENDVMADNNNYVNKRSLFVELYTATKDIDAEATVEEKLSGAGLTWYKEADFLNDEKLFQITYEMEVLING